MVAEILSYCRCNRWLARAWSKACTSLCGGSFVPSSFGEDVRYGWDHRGTLYDRVSLSELGGIFLVERVNVRGLKFAGWNLLREQDIEFVEGPILGLRESEERPDENDQCTATPNEAGIAAQVPRSRVNEVRFQRAANDASDVIGVTSETDGLLTETGRTHLGGQSPAELSGGELEDEGPYQGKNGLGHCDSGVCCPDIEDTDKAQNDGHEKHAPDIDGASTEIWHQEEPVA
jgi:hypothetical protein